MQSVAGHALLSAGFITYLANMVEAERGRLIASWLQALTVSGLLGGLGGDGPGALAARDSMTTGGFSLLTFLSSEGTLLRWKAQGLPADKLSAENAIVILNARQTPLIIDPSSAAVEWLKTNLRASGTSLEVRHLPNMATGSATFLIWQLHRAPSPYGNCIGHLPHTATATTGALVA